MQKNMKNLILFFIVFNFCFSTGFAKEQKIIAVFPTWAPYGYLEEGKAVGFEIETFQAVMDQMKIPVEFIHQPWKRCLHSVKNGYADVVISALKVEERMQYIYYPDEPISISKTAFFTLKDKKILFNGSFESLKGHTIGVTNGFSYGSGFDSSDFLTKDESTETQAVVIKVLLGRNELGVGNIAVINMIAKKQKSVNEIRFLKPLLHSQKLYVGFSKAKKHENLTTLFSISLTKFKKSDGYRRLIQKFNME